MRRVDLCREVLYESLCDVDPIGKFGIFTMTFASVQEITGKFRPMRANRHIIRDRSN
jgi:hypothetical protein